MVIGPSGRNFAAGMSGGIAYVLADKQQFKIHCNLDMVDLDELDEEDIKTVKTLLTKHLEYTKSTVAKKILENRNENYRSKFVKVMPKDYKRVLAAIKKAEAEGTSVDEAVMEAAHG